MMVSRKIAWENFKTKLVLATSKLKICTVSPVSSLVQSLVNVSFMIKNDKYLKSRSYVNCRMLN
jgi:hypothetical protein